MYLYIINKQGESLIGPSDFLRPWDVTGTKSSTSRGTRLPECERCNGFVVFLFWVFIFHRRLSWYFWNDHIKLSHETRSGSTSQQLIAEWRWMFWRRERSSSNDVRRKSKTNETNAREGKRMSVREEKFNESVHCQGKCPRKWSSGEKENCLWKEKK